MFNYTAIRLGDLVIFNIFMAGFRNNLDSDNHEMRGSMTVIRQISPRGLAGLQWSDVRLPGTVKSPKHSQHLEEFGLNVCLAPSSHVCLAQASSGW